MTTAKVTPDTNIKPGQWVCKKSRHPHGIAAAPQEVIKTSGQRIYVKDAKGDGRADWMLQKAIAFVSDRKEEAEAVHAISQSQLSSIKAIEADHAAKIAALCIPHHD